MADKSKKNLSSAQLFSLVRAFTKKRKSKIRSVRKSLFLRFSATGIVLLLAGFVFYLFQPLERKEEIRFLSYNYLLAKRDIHLDEFAWDIWNLYFSRDFVPSDYEVGDQSFVYGGLPREKSSLNRRFLQVLRNRGYWVGYDERLRNPAWVAYRLFDVGGKAEISPRPDSFSPDERTLIQVRSEDYTGSGFDRGHMAPSFAMARCYGREAQEETFLMSNIAPQRHALNAGIWKTLEMREAINYPARFREIWVLTGPLFRSNTAKVLPSGIPIPDAFYKIYLDELNGKIRATAFLFEQDDSGKEALEKRLCSIDYIEKLTGLDFFPELDEVVQQELESSVAARVW